MIKKLFTFLTVLTLLSAGAASAEILPPETPAPARYHEAPEATPEPPMILDATRNASCLDGLRFRLDTKLLHIWFPIIANADEAVIVYGDEVWLIDCGDKGMGLRGVRLLEELGVTKIDRLFNTHPHHDHLGGLQVTNEAAPVGELCICFPEDSTDTMIAAMEYVNEANIPLRTYGDGDVFTMKDGKVSLKFFCPDDESLDMNNSSALSLLEYGSRRMLFMADMERSGQEAVLASRSSEELHAEIIKYPHHGKSGLLDAFYEAIRPSFAIVTNVYVDWGGIEYLNWKQVPFIFTCTHDAYVHLYTDGSTWVVERVPINQVTPLFPKADADQQN